MRSSVLFTAAFAAVALATPVFDKRGEVVVTDAEVVFVTQVVTVTEGQPAPSAEPTYSKKAYGWRKKGRKGRKTGGYGSAPAPVPTEPAPVPSSAEVPAPAPSTYEPAPQPEPTTEAPAPAPTSYEQPAPAPTSYEQPAPAPSTTQAAPPPAYTPPASTDTSYKGQVLRHHNAHRANHSAADLVWSDSLAATAAKIAASCVYAHDTVTDGGNYGQNIAAGQKSDKIGSIISDQFYNDEWHAFEGQYGLANPDEKTFGSYGHLTQIVWKDTTEVACVTQDCTATGLANVGGNVPPFFTVCNYKTPGNVMGTFDKNVGQCLGQPTFTGSD